MPRTLGFPSRVSGTIQNKQLTLTATVIFGAATELILRIPAPTESVVAGIAVATYAAGNTASLFIARDTARRTRLLLMQKAEAQINQFEQSACHAADQLLDVSNELSRAISGSPSHEQGGRTMGIDPPRPSTGPVGISF